MHINERVRGKKGEKIVVNEYIDDTIVARVEGVIGILTDAFSHKTTDEYEYVVIQGELCPTLQVSGKSAVIIDKYLVNDKSLYNCVFEDEYRKQHLQKEVPECPGPHISLPLWGCSRTKCPDIEKRMKCGKNLLEKGWLVRDMEIINSPSLLYASAEVAEMKRVIECFCEELPEQKRTELLDRLTLANFFIKESQNPSTIGTVTTADGVRNIMHLIINGAITDRDGSLTIFLEDENEDMVVIASSIDYDYICFDDDKDVLSLLEFLSMLAKSSSKYTITWRNKQS